MRSVTKYGLAATGVAAAMIVVPLPAAAAEDTTPETGTVTVTRFDDRYADGIFDASKTARDGWTDVKNANLTARLVASNGAQFYGYTTDQNDYIFENVPVGPAQVFLVTPNQPAGEVLFDATDATSADDIVRLPIGKDPFGMDSGVLSLDVDADGEHRVVGMSAFRIAADIKFADGSIASGLTGIEFGSGDEWYAGSEYQFNGGYGTYEAFGAGGYVRHVPDELGVRITVPAGYQIASVTANDGGDIAVAERDGAFWIDAAAATTYFAAPKFTVTLAEIPDTTKPGLAVKEGAEFTTKSGETYGKISFKLSDDRAVDRVAINGVVKDLTNNKWSDVNFVKAGTAGAVHGKNELVVFDAAGNSSSLTFNLDGKGPNVTVKDGEKYTVGGSNGYDLISFKLNDAAKVDKVEINGKVKDLTNNAWSDVNFVKVGTFGAIKGENTLIAYDVLGNTTTVEFTRN